LKECSWCSESGLRSWNDVRTWFDSELLRNNLNGSVTFSHWAMGALNVRWLIGRGSIRMSRRPRRDLGRSENGDQIFEGIENVGQEHGNLSFGHPN
jgi:hypothetical protein